jgi:EAL domain-containing protein (putative c-di-GMP-specific phosphodiesterase class I)
MVRLCEELGAAVVAEGIETREELEAVLDAGVGYGQGYYLARPNFPPPQVPKDLVPSPSSKRKTTATRPPMRERTLPPKPAAKKTRRQTTRF